MILKKLPREKIIILFLHRKQQKLLIIIQLPTRGFIDSVTSVFCLENNTGTNENYFSKTIILYYLLCSIRRMYDKLHTYIHK